MARVVLPESRLRARRKQRRVRLGIVAALAVLLLLALLAGASYLPFLQIKEIQVSGTSTLATSTIENYMEAQVSGKYAYLFPKRNILLYPKRAISAGLLAKFPELKVADVHAVNFHTIAVAVVERSSKALWCQYGACYLMDQEGVVYAPATWAEGLVTYYGAASSGALPRQYLTPPQFESLFALVDALSQKSAAGLVTWVKVDAQGDAEASFDNGFVLKFAIDEAGGDVFERFALALTADPFKAHALSEFEYLDLRFGDKLYYKLR